MQLDTELHCGLGCSFSLQKISLETVGTVVDVGSFKQRSLKYRPTLLFILI